eukprot:TRINITY_DN80457_c0_g1_i1.p1 TRINITY_DN80457_c0_g1~~TRINITY_DN80457_c0_g1_i1.p1  ORF type:complete len:640 (-),score=225.33 TRINITY_DN80457_c0_g1_i1:115-2034(-)
MEEVDGIILASLRQIGCSVDPSTSIGELGANEFIQICSFCLQKVDDSLRVPDSLPRDMSARFRLGQVLAEALKSLGYKTEVGYHQFLYPSIHDTRRILRFLVELVPKQVVEEAFDARSQLQRVKSEAFSSAKNRLWTIPLRKPLRKTGEIAVIEKEGASPIPFHARRLMIPADLRPHAFAAMRTARAQSELQRSFACSVLQREATSRGHRIGSKALEEEGHERPMHPEVLRRRWANVGNAIARSVAAEVNTHAISRLPTIEDVVAFVKDASIKSDDSGSGRMRRTRFQHEAEFGFERAGVGVSAAQMKGLLGEDVGSVSSTPVVLTEEDRERMRAEQLEGLEGKVIALEEEISSLERRAAEQDVETNALCDEMEKIKTERVPLATEHDFCHRLAGHLEDPAGSRRALKGQANEHAARLLEMESQWESRRTALVRAYHDLVLRLGELEASAGERGSTVDAIREETHAALAQARDGQAHLETIREELERLPKDVDRGVLIRRIMDIVKNVKSQQVEIEKIVDDIRVLKKEINRLSEAIERSFVATDEMIFRDAQAAVSKKDAASKDVYREVVEFKQSFEKLVSVVEEKGTVRLQSEDLEKDIERLEARVKALDMKQLLSDLQDVQMENDMMKREIGVETDR